MKVRILIDDEKGSVTELTVEQYIEFRNNIEKLFGGAFQDPFDGYTYKPDHLANIPSITTTGSTITDKWINNNWTYNCTHKDHK